MNELKYFIDLTRLDRAAFIVEFIVFLADFAIMFYFAERLFLKRKYTFVFVNVFAVSGAAILALLLWNACCFFTLGILVDVGAMLFAAIALRVLYKDKMLYKTAYLLIIGSVYTIVDIFVVHFYSLTNIGQAAFILGKDEDALFMVLLCTTLRVLKLTVAVFAYRCCKRLAVTGSQNEWAALNYFEFILFLGVLFFGAFTQYFYLEDWLYSGKSAITMIAAAVLLVGQFLLLRFFPKIYGFIRTDGLGGTFEAAPQAADGLSVREMQKLRHDVKNNIATVTALIDNGEPEEAKRLLCELGARLGSALGGDNRTGVPAIDAVLAEKAKLCGERGIALDIHIEPLPETKIPPLDLSSVISNLLDNAIEAAEKCADPMVAIRIFKYKMYLAIVCENPTVCAPQVVNGLLVTTKPGEGHGCGVEIVSGICRNNNGRFQYEFNGKLFKVSAFLEL